MPIIFRPDGDTEQRLRSVVKLRGQRHGDLNRFLVEAVRHYILATVECPKRTHAIRVERGLDEGE